MGLQMTLPKGKNHMDVEFIDAYWAITELNYDMIGLHFKLACYPSREARLLEGTNIEEPSIGGYGLCPPIYNPELYSWSPFFRIEDVFPDGIPLGRDAQLTQIYKFIKEYTGLPFEDVFEDAAAEVEPAHEEPTDQGEDTPSDPEPQPVEDPEPEAAPEPEIKPDPVLEETSAAAEPEETEEPETEPEPEPVVYHNPLSL